MRLHTMLLLSCLILAGDLGAQVGPPPQQTQSAAVHFTGVWRGQMDDLPAVDIVISTEGGQLTGGILFYFHTRTDVNHPWTSKPGLPEPMFNMKIEGGTLHFRVSHRRAHPPRTLNDPPVQFRLTLTDPDKAEFVNESESARGPLVMTRRDD